MYLLSDHLLLSIPGNSLKAGHLGRKTMSGSTLKVATPAGSPILSSISANSSLRLPHFHMRQPASRKGFLSSRIKTLRDNLVFTCDNPLVAVIKEVVANFRLRQPRFYLRQPSSRSLLMSSRKHSLATTRWSHTRDCDNSVVAKLLLRQPNSRTMNACDNLAVATILLILTKY